MTERIVVASDHAGYELKECIKTYLVELGYQIEDVGTDSTEPVDYPIFTRKAAEKVASGEFRRGIIFCGTGQGDAMVANKIHGVRAALCWDTLTAEMSRAHNDANILVLGGWLIGNRLAREMVRIWLVTPFSGGRHQRRIDQMMTIESDMKRKPRKIHDVSLSIYPGMHVWPGNSEVEQGIGRSISAGGSSNISWLHLGSHTGTHIDAPKHFIDVGLTVDNLEPGVLLGHARLFQLPDVHHIDRTTLEGLDLHGVTHVLFSTRNSALFRHPKLDLDYAYIDGDAATYLVNLGIKLVGIDYLSIERYKAEGWPVHNRLLAAGIVIVEGLDFTGVPAGDYEIIALPLKIKDGDGAPARVFLREL